MSFLYPPIAVALVLVSLLGTGTALAFRRAWRPSAAPDVQELASQTAYSAQSRDKVLLAGAYGAAVGLVLNRIRTYITAARR